MYALDFSLILIWKNFYSFLIFEFMGLFRIWIYIRGANRGMDKIWLEYFQV